MAETAVPRLYFRRHRVGDILRGPPAIRVEGKSVEWEVGNSAQRAVPIERGPGFHLKIEQTVHLKKGLEPGGDANESTRDFYARRFRWALDMGLLMATDGFHQPATNAGILALVYNADTDEGLTTSQGDPGAGVLIDLDSELGLAIGDWVYLWNALTNQDELVQVLTVPSSQSFTCDLASTIDSGSNAALVVQGWQSAYLEEGFDVDGADPVTWDAAADVRLVFSSNADPVVT